MPNLILELYSEEMPAGLQLFAIEKLKSMIADAFAENKLNFTEIKGFVTPLRLIIQVNDLPNVSSEEIIEKKGPKIDAPSSAIDGFIKSVGFTSKEELKIKNIDGKDIYFAYTKIPEQNVNFLLSKILSEILGSFPWPKSMRWGKYKIRWIRPLHNIMCLFNNQILDFSFGFLQANNFSFGHKFMNKEKFIVTSAEQFFQELSSRFVVYDHLARRNYIKSKCLEFALAKNLKLVEDEDLIDEVTGLVEYPNPLLGIVDTKYMQLPKEVLITTMQKNQKYFCFIDDKNQLAPYFITFANIKTNNDQIIIDGNQKVLAARLEDALFFWHEDLKTPLISNLDKLKNVVFHQKLGSVYDKILRITEMAKFLNQYITYDFASIERAAQLIKADLVTEMVGEFPELQGITGRYYAGLQGENDEVAKAIEEHYLPVGQDSYVPNNKLSLILAIADKIDTIIGLWIVGEKPTGSKDPFALRRATIGIIRILIDNKISIPIKKIIEEMRIIYLSSISSLTFYDSLTVEVVQFFINRFVAYNKSNNVRHDIVMSVTKNFNNIYHDHLRISSLSDFLHTKEGESLLLAYIRAVNIVEVEEKRNGAPFTTKVDPSLFEQDEEIELYNSLISLPEKINAEIELGNYFAALNLLNEIYLPINNFFQNVTVNDENSNLRRNRLALLNMIKILLNEVSDFSLLEV